MIIDEIYIRSFGKLRDFRLTLTENMNVIYGENEAGKSTILAFIRMMLYGGRDRKRYQPRDGSQGSGTLIFRHDGKKYQLERTFGASRRSDVIALKNAETGASIPVPLKQEPGEWLFDLAEDAFVNTVFIGQLACVFDGSKSGAGVAAKLGNLNCSGNEELSFSKTDERLKKAANALSMRGRGKIPEAEQRLQRLEEEYKNLNISREILHKKNLLLIKLKRENEKNRQRRLKCGSYLKICAARKELDEFETISAMRSEIARRRGEPGAAQAGGESPDSLLNKAKNIYRECEKADAVIANFEKDFTEQNARYKEFLKDYESIGGIADIDFDKVARLTHVSAGAGSGQKVPVPLWITLGLTACLFLTLLFILLSVKTIWLMLPAIAAAFGAWYFAAQYVKNGKTNTKKKEHANANNGAELAVILRKADCADVDELMHKRTELESFRRRLNDFRAVRESTTGNLKAAKGRKAALENSLFRLLEPVAQVASMPQAVEVINGLEGATAQGEKDLTVLTAKLETLMGGRDFATMQSRALSIKGELAKVKNLDEFDPSAADDFEKELRELDAEISEKNADIARLEGEIESANSGEKTPEAFKAEIEDCRARLAAYRADFSALELARTALAAANEEMSSAFAPAINVSAAKILSEITGGRYDDVRVSVELEPAVVDKTDRALVSKDSLSGGTADQLYLALRLAVSAKMFEDAEPLPLFMDEATVQYDDERMKKAVAYLSGLPQQVVFFTCKKRELEIAAEFGVNSITL